MVNVPSIAAQSSDTEQKKRKQTIERAKATHLSRQLQIRLQYAKLKVDHGWQKQNLNEVENLYFRHSHMRGPRSSMATTFPHLALSPTTQAGSPSNSANSHQTQSNLSFRQNLLGLRTSGTNTTTEHRIDPQPLTSEIPNPPNFVHFMPEPIDDDAFPAISDQSQESSPLKTVSFLTSTGVVRGLSSAATIPHDGQPTSSTTTPNKSSRPRARPKSRSKRGSSLSPSSPASASPYKQSMLTPSVDNDGHSGSSNSHETNGGTLAGFLSGIGRGDGGNHTKGGGGGYGGQEMTYDSFWLSHSSASTGVRPVGGL